VRPPALTSSSACIPCRIGALVLLCQGATHGLKPFRQVSSSGRSRAEGRNLAYTSSLESLIVWPSETSVRFYERVRFQGSPDMLEYSVCPYILWGLRAAWLGIRGSRGTSSDTPPGSQDGRRAHDRRCCRPGPAARRRWRPPAVPTRRSVRAARSHNPAGGAAKL
jgi:hypothetical protein